MLDLKSTSNSSTFKFLFVASIFVLFFTVTLMSNDKGKDLEVKKYVLETALDIYPNINEVNKGKFKTPSECISEFIQDLITPEQWSIIRLVDIENVKPVAKLNEILLEINKVLVAQEPQVPALAKIPFVRHFFNQNKLVVDESSLPSNKNYIFVHGNELFICQTPSEHVKIMEIVNAYNHYAKGEEQIRSDIKFFTGKKSKSIKIGDMDVLNQKEILSFNGQLVSSHCIVRNSYIGDYAKIEGKFDPKILSVDSGVLICVRPFIITIKFIYWMVFVMFQKYWE